MKATNRNTSGIILEYEEALEEVRDYLQERISEELGRQKTNEKDVIKDKEYLRQKKEKYRDLILEAMSIKNIRVRGYEGESVNIFIGHMGKVIGKNNKSSNW